MTEKRSLLWPTRASIQESAIWGRDEVSSNGDKSGQRERGALAVSGHPLQCGLCKRKDGISVC